MVRFQARVGKMMQQLRALTTLPEVLSSNPSNHMVAHSHLKWDPMPSSGVSKDIDSVLIHKINLKGRNVYNLFSYPSSPGTNGLTVSFIYLIIFKKIYLFILCMWVHCSCLQTHQKRALDPMTDGCEPPCGCWDLNSGPSQEQSVLLPAEPSRQPIWLVFK